MKVRVLVLTMLVAAALALAACATPAAAPADSGAASTEATTEAAEDVGERREDVVDAAEPLEAALRRALVAEAIVELALLGVGEHAVGLGGLLELFLRLAIAGSAIGVILHGEAAVGFLDLGVIGGAGDAEHFIVVAFTSTHGAAS